MRLRDRKAYVRSLPHCNVGTIGHLGHGKTTLTAALSARLARAGRPAATTIALIDRGAQWRGEGVTIGCLSGYVEYVSNKRHYSHVDCPGHADYIKNALTGLSQMNTAILVVSAVDSVMRQTREHATIARHMGVERAVVFVNQCDLAQDEALLDLVEEESREALIDAGFDGDEATVLRGSALGALRGDPRWIPAIDALIEAIDERSEEVAMRDEAPALLPIWNRYSIAGRGTVVTGVLQRGVIERGVELQLITARSSRVHKVLDVETYRQTLAVAQRNDAIGVLLLGLSRYDVHRGAVLCAPGTVPVAIGCEAIITMQTARARTAPIVTGYAPQLFCGTLDVTARITLPAGLASLHPGERATVTMSFARPVAFDERRAILLRDSGSTVALGTITRLFERP